MKTNATVNTNTTSAAQTYAIAEEFDKALRLVRHALAERELSITSEWDTSGARASGSGQEPHRSRLPLVENVFGRKF